MSYFKNFPKVNYSFNGESAVTTNLTVYAEVLDQVRLSSSFYQDYYIKNGERADHVAFEYYGNPQLHWLFYLMNPKLREQGWPMLYNEIVSQVKKDHPNQTLRFDADITTTFSVGQVIKGYTSESIGTILNINLDLGQVTVETDGLFEADELIQDVETSVVYSFTILSQSKEHLAAHHYTLNGEYVDINPYASIPPTVVKVTFLDFYVQQNDELKQIRVIKPSALNQVIGAFRDAVES